MFHRHKMWIRSLLALWVLLAATGCSNEPQSEQKLAYLSVHKDSEYEKTFRELHLGVLYDYYLKLTAADTSWVKLWIEGYKDGEKIDPFPLTELSLGLYPDQQTVEGPLGFGIVHPGQRNASLLLYSPGGSIPNHPVGDLFYTDAASSWGYAIGDEEVALESGETKLLGVYRQMTNSIRTYDYQNPDDIARMIQEDKLVLLLKIQVDKVK